MSTVPCPGQLPLDFSTSTKTCTACRQILTLGAFYVKYRQTGQRMSRCKRCIKERTLHPERFAAERAARLAAQHTPTLLCRTCGVEKDRAAFRRHRRSCKACERPPIERQRKYQATYLHRHEEELRQRRKDRYQANADRLRARGSDWRSRHRRECVAYTMRHRQKNPDTARTACLRRRAHLLGAPGSHTAKEWADLKRRYGYQCLCCGRKEPDITLALDHVVPLSKGGSDDISNAQPLCTSCNCRKHTRTIDYRPR